MDRKFFSIIICSYNGSEKITKSIDSVINQIDYDRLVDELILINNKSSDSTEVVMKQYTLKKNNIKYYFEGNPGLSYARKKGIINAKAEWIIFVDDDNILNNNWIIEAEKYITQNSKDLGAFNGAVVPITEFKINHEEKKIMKASLKVLACTHYSFEEIDKNESKHPFRVPIGAGLVIRKEPMCDLITKGWLKSTGRIGNKLQSGEDTEMCMYVRKQGYTYGYSPSMVIQHIIPKSRLNIDYQIKLWGFIGKSVYDVISNEKLYVLKRIAYLGILYYRNYKLLKDNNEFKKRFYKVYIKSYIHSLVRDRFYKR